MKNFQDGLGPHYEEGGRRRRAKAICPFDKDNIEDIENMDIEFNMKRDVKVVSDDIGKRRFMK